MTTPSSLTDRVEQRVEGLARRMVSRFVDAIPVYQTLPQEQLDGEILQLCISNLRTLLQCLRERRAPNAAELADSRASAARRAEERVPLQGVLHAYMTGTEIGWAALTDAATPEEASELLGYVPLVLGYLQAVTAVVTDGWVEEQQSIVGEERDARRALTEALLSGGETTSGLIDRAGIQPEERYRAVALRMDRSADEATAGVSAAVAGRRKVRRVVLALEALVGGPALTLLDPTGGAAALPVEDVEAVHATIAEAARANVWLAHSELVRLPALPAAWEEAREVRRLVTVLTRDPGVYTISDVILEYTITNDQRAVDGLRSVLAPIADREGLLETLDAWFGVDFDRQLAARALTIHPNTLDYRLRRISALMGQDVSSARGTQLLGAALIARRLST